MPGQAPREHRLAHARAGRPAAGCARRPPRSRAPAAPAAWPRTSARSGALDSSRRGGAARGQGRGSPRSTATASTSVARPIGAHALDQRGLGGALGARRPGRRARARRAASAATSAPRTGRTRAVEGELAERGDPAQPLRRQLPRRRRGWRARSPGRSPAPSLRTVPGARLTVTRRSGKASSAEAMPERTRSRASCTALSGRPTIVNAGTPRRDVRLDLDGDGVEAERGRRSGRWRARDGACRRGGARGSRRGARECQGAHALRTWRTRRPSKATRSTRTSHAQSLRASSHSAAARSRSRLPRARSPRPRCRARRAAARLTSTSTSVRPRRQTRSTSAGGRAHAMREHAVAAQHEQPAGDALAAARRPPRQARAGSDREQLELRARRERPAVRDARPVHAQRCEVRGRAVARVLLEAVHRVHAARARSWCGRA